MKRKDKKMYQNHIQKRLYAFLLITFFVSSHSLLYASNDRQEKMDIRMENASLIDVFKYIDKNTEYSVLYRTDQLKDIKIERIELKNASIDEILRFSLKETDLEYRVNDNIIIISKKSTPQAETTRRITGIIIDGNREPLIGATVRIKDTSIGTVANENGEFTLNIPEGVNVVVVSFIGYLTKEVEIGRNNSITIILEEDLVEMDDVVVTGFFDRKKEGFAGSITTIRKEELQKISTGNIFTTISAIDAGFKINEDNVNGSNPNNIPDFTIRGKGSFQTGSTSPLFILDGFEVTTQKVFDMDINRIESITLLKDAAATILYGSRAANGVIVIETTNPRPGEIRVTYDFKPTIAFADLTGYDLMNAKEKLQYEKDAGIYDYSDNDLLGNYGKDENYYSRYKNVLEGVNTYWLSKPVNDAFSHSHSLFVEGGIEEVRYGIEAFYNNQNGIMKKSGRDRIGMAISLIYRIKDKVIIKNYMGYTHTHARNSPYGDYSVYGQLNQYERIHDDNGEIIPILISGESNPLFDAALPYRDFTKSQEFIERLNIDWIALEGLRVRAQLGITKSNSESEKYSSPYSSKYYRISSYNERTGEYYYSNSDLGLENRGELTMETGNGLRFSSNITVNYNKLFEEVHLMYLGLGMEINTNKDYGSGFTMTGFPDDRYSDPAFAIKYKDNTKATSYEQRTRAVGYFGNINYIYDNRFFIDGSFRYDGSSQFGSDNRFAPFWSLGTGWNIHNESFWPKSSGITMLKPRFSYGITGNQEFSAYQAKTMFEFKTDRMYNKGIAATLLGYGNPDLKWQNQYQTNVGLDFGMVKDRLRVNFNYYHKITKDMLTAITTAPSLGFPDENFIANLGKIKNTGYEIGINGVIIRDKVKELEWTLFFQGARNKNKLVKISEQLKGINEKNNEEKFIPGQVYEEGESMTAIKAVKSLGIDPVTGKEIFLKKDGTPTYTWDADDKITCGDTEPKLFGNIGTNLYWKGWNLNMVFKYRFGGHTYNQTLASRVEGGNIHKNLDRRALKYRWREPGDVADYKNIKDFLTTYVSTRFVQKDNTVELTSLSLSYEFKKAWLHKYRLSNLRVSFYANDLFRISSIKEERGLSYPFQRSYVFGLNMSF